MQVGSHHFGVGTRSFIISEIAQAHEGSLGLAHSFIDAAAKARVDAVKFQTHIANADFGISDSREACSGSKSGALIIR
jgi:N,N'-diacetyllegionaminate synthase